MPETNPHKATLHNLGIILIRCNLVGGPYLVFYHELADTMGFEPWEAASMLDSLHGADFHLPETTHEREFELRMGMNMLVQETPLAEHQRHALVEFAQKLNLPTELVPALEEANIRKNMQQLRHFLIYQNLYAALRHAHLVTPEQEEMLAEVALALSIHPDRIQELGLLPIPDFVVPDEPEERLFTIKNMILLLLTGDGEDPGMFAAILRFTLKAGYSLMELEEWMEESRTLIHEQAIQLEETTQHNLSVYLDLFDQLEALPWNTQVLASWLKDVLRTKSLPSWPFASRAHNKTLADLLWILAVRAVRLDHHLLVMGPLYLEMMIESQQLSTLATPLLELETNRGGNLIALPSMPIEAVEEEIATFFLSLGW